MITKTANKDQLIEKLLAEIESMKRENIELRALVKQQNETIKQLNQALYGRSSEKSSAVNASNQKRQSQAADSSGSAKKKAC